MAIVSHHLTFYFIATESLQDSFEDHNVHILDGEDRWFDGTLNLNFFPLHLHFRAMNFRCCMFVILPSLPAEHIICSLMLVDCH